MPKGTLTEDGATRWLVVGESAAHIALSGNFGGGTVALEQRIDGVAVAVLSEGVAVTFTTATDVSARMSEGDVVRLVLSSSTAPALLYSVGGVSASYSS